MEAVSEPNQTIKDTAEIKNFNVPFIIKFYHSLWGQGSTIYKSITSSPLVGASPMVIMTKFAYANNKLGLSFKTLTTKFILTLFAVRFARCMKFFLECRDPKNVVDRNLPEIREKASLETKRNFELQ